MLQEPVVISYINGAGGNRLKWKLLGFPWTANPLNKLHFQEINVKNLYIDVGYPKFPAADYGEVEEVSLNKYPILTTHGMYSQVLRKIFPTRKIVKIYCDFRPAFLRHWTVFGRQHLIDHSKNKDFHPDVGDMQRYIKWLLDYYRGNIDFDHDYAVIISPGRGNFENFMSREFRKIQNPQFDEAWKLICQDPDYRDLANLPIVQTALSLEKP